MENEKPTTARTVAVSGASGLVGTALTGALSEAGHRVLRLVRREPNTGQHEIGWKPNAGRFDPSLLQNVDVVVNLSGKSIASGRWTKSLRQEIRGSRVKSTELLAQAMADIEPRPQLFLSASAVGFYGDRRDAWLDEESDAGEGFLPSVVRDWERATGAASDAGVRVVNARLATVLSSEGGALKTMLTPFRLGLGGPFGDGHQYWSWISIDDVVGAMLHIIEHTELRGPVNFASPSPVTNREFAQTLGRAIHRPALLPFPRVAARVMFGQMADEVLLASARVKPARLIDSGYEFRHPTLDAALAHLL